MPKPMTVCKPTERKAKHPVVAKYCHIWGPLSSLPKLAKSTQTGASLVMAEKSVKLR